ncbi:MAG: hypothetical protein HDT48_03400 [Ruminococcaceae bacterium]|nr:hypothetical protein [Oscillospiraceae bacterium]
MQNFGKRIRKILSVSAAAGLILSFFGTANAISYMTTEEPQDGIVTVPYYEEETTEEVPTAIVVITTPEETTTADPDAVNPFDTTSSDDVNPFNTTSSDTAGIIDLTPDTGDTSSSDSTSDTSGTAGSTPGTGESGTGSNTPDSSNTEPIVTDVETTARLVLTYYTFNLEIGQVVQLYWWVENGTADLGTARYYSDNTAVATVNEAGIITARGAGSADITVRVGDLTATARVNSAASIAQANALVVNETSHTLKIGESVYIQASVLPEEAAGRYSIVFSSDSPEIAEVDENGIVTAKSTGEAYITVSCLNTDFSETVYIKVTDEEMVYQKARLDGCLYDSGGNPTEGIAIRADGITAVTDKNGYFSFSGLDRKDIAVQIAENERAVCVFGLYGDSTVCLLYNGSTLECFSGYEEMAERFAVSTVTFDSPAKSVHVGDIYMPYYQYEPKEASVTQVLYISSDESVATVDKNGVITAKSIGEAIITLILNGGQAQTFFTLTVDPAESGKYTAIIAAAETAVLLAAAAAAVVIYNRYRKKAGRQAGYEGVDEDYEDYEDLDEEDLNDDD